MKELQAKRIFTRAMNSPLFACLLVFATVLIYRGVYDVYKKDKMARMNKEVSEKRYTELDLKRTELEKELKRLRSDSGLEEELRRRFQVLREGERVLVIVDKEEEPEPKAEEKKNWYEDLWESFVGAIGY